jgi:hypothetical protein
MREVRKSSNNVPHKKLQQQKNKRLLMQHRDANAKMTRKKRINRQMLPLLRNSKKSKECWLWPGRKKKAKGLEGDC